MKHFFFILVVILFSSCKKNPKVIVENNLQQYMEKNAKDPSSYEQVNTLFIDTIWSKELAKIVLPDLEKDLLEAEDKLGQGERELKRTNDILETGKFPENHRKAYESLNDLAKVMIQSSKSTRDFNSNLIKDIKGFSQEDSILFYQVLHRARLKNSYGAIDLEDYFVIVNPYYEILHIETDKAESFSFVKKTFINRAGK